MSNRAAPNVLHPQFVRADGVACLAPGQDFAKPTAFRLDELTKNSSKAIDDLTGRHV